MQTHFSIPFTSPKSSSLPLLNFIPFNTSLNQLMASSSFSIPIALIASLVIVFHLPSTVTSNFLSSSPLLSPIFDSVCKEVACGKGSCRPTKNNTIPFECVCDSGWKQPTSSNGFNFLPCVLPNCTIDVSCSHAASPAAAPKNTTKGSIFDPCGWNICGSGTCNRSSSNSSSSSSYSYSCSCSNGSYNLMNSTSLPCYPSCALGGDCQNLGISVSNHSTAQPPALSNTANLARSLQHEKFSWIIVLVVFALITVLA